MPSTLRSERTNNIGTTATAIGSYSAPSVTAGVAITGLSIANTSPTLTITVNVSLFDGATQIYLIKNCQILPGSSINLADDGHRITMNSGDQVMVTSSVVSSVDAVMSVCEITN